MSAWVKTGDFARRAIAMRPAYLAISGRIRRELGELAQVMERTERIWQQGFSSRENSEDDYYVDAVALNLHGFYAGIERLLEINHCRRDRSN